MMVAREAEEAWCPPTLRPSSLGRMWLALWIVHVASHSTLRCSWLRQSRSFVSMRPSNRLLTPAAARRLRPSGQALAANKHGIPISIDPFAWLNHDIAEA